MTGLPKHVHKKGPSYYRVKDNVWFRLSRDLDEALRLNAVIEKTGNERPGRWKFSDLDDHFPLLLRNARWNAKKRGIDFSLSRSDFQSMVTRSNYRCEITGLPFSLTKSGSTGKRPMAPSIDRIDSASGYSAENCRLILWAVNAGMQDWGMETYLAIAEKAMEKQHNLESHLEAKRRRKSIIRKISRQET